MARRKMGFLTTHSVFALTSLPELYIPNPVNCDTWSAPIYSQGPLLRAKDKTLTVPRRDAKPHGRRLAHGNRSYPGASEARLIPKPDASTAIQVSFTALRSSLSAVD